MEQGSLEWKAWRRAGIGATDASVIMGVSPFKSLAELYMEKIGESFSKPTGEYAMLRGLRMESTAREAYERDMGFSCPPCLATHPDYPFLKASLDGFSEERSLILEIKCPSQAKHWMAESGIVPDFYYPQLQHQLMVTGADRAHYWSFHQGKGVLVEVLPEPDYIADMLEKEVHFWTENVCKRVPPW